MAAPKKVDYSKIEPGWRAGSKSPRQLAEDYAKETGGQVSHTSITKHFTKLGVPRDLKDKINAKAQSMVNVAMVNAMGNSETLAKDSEIIEVNAAIQAATLLSHRRDISRYRNLATQLLTELEVETNNQESFAELAEMIIWKSEDGDATQTRDEVNRMNRMQMLFDRVMSNPGRVDSLKKLGDTLKTLIALERQALGLKDDEQPSNPSDEKPRTLEAFYARSSRT